MNEKELMQEIKNNNCSKSLDELYEMHCGLIIKVMQKYLRQMKFNYYNEQDAVTDQKYVLWKSVLSFDESKNIKFCTYLGNNIRFFCLNYLNHESKINEKRVDDYEEKVKTIPTTNNDYHSYNIDYIFNILGQLKDNRISKIFELKYLGDKKMTFKDIGQELNISGWWVNLLHRHGCEVLKKKMEDSPMKADFV